MTTTILVLAENRTAAAWPTFPEASKLTASSDATLDGRVQLTSSQPAFRAICRQFTQSNFNSTFPWFLSTKPHGGKNYGRSLKISDYDALHLVITLP